VVERCNVHKAKTATECLERIKNLDSMVDVVITSSDLATDRESMLIANVKKMDSNIKILVIGDENNDKTRIFRLWRRRVCIKTYEFLEHCRQGFDAISAR
jgi:hypothetical protein